MMPRANDLARRLADGPDSYFGAPLPPLPDACRITPRSIRILRDDTNPNRGEDVYFRLLRTMSTYMASLEIERWYREDVISLEQRQVMWRTVLGTAPPELDPA